MKTSIHKKIAVVSVGVLIVSIMSLLFVIMYERHEVRSKSDVSTKISEHLFEDCKNNQFFEYVLGEAKEGYQLLVLCGGYVIPNNPTVVIGFDQVFLKDIEKNSYYALMPYVSPVTSSYKIEIVDYPRLFIRSCWEGCSPSVMVELNQGPNQPEHYFDLREIIYRNNVNEYIGLVNGKVVMAGERKVTQFDPVTFNMKTLFEVKDTETIGYYNSFPIFMSSVTKLDDTRIQFKVYGESNQVTSTATSGAMIEPRESYSKTLEIK